jgi:hypothetical protein
LGGAAARTWIEWRLIAAVSLAKSGFGHVWAVTFHLVLIYPQKRVILIERRPRNPASLHAGRQTEEYQKWARQR